MNNTISITDVNTITTPNVNIRLFNAETDKEYSGKLRANLEVFAKDNDLKIGAFLTIPQMIKHGICFAGVKRFEGVIAIPIKTKENTGGDVVQIEKKEDGYHAKTENEEIKFKHQKIVLYPLELCSFYENFDVDKMLAARHMKNAILTNEEKAMIIPNRLKFMAIHDGKTPVKTDAPVQVDEVKKIEVIKPRTTKKTRVKAEKQEEKQPVENKKDSSICDIELNDELREALKYALKFVSKEDFRDYLKCVQVTTYDDNIVIHASDGYRLFKYNTNIECSDMSSYLIKVNKNIVPALQVSRDFKELFEKIELEKCGYPNLECVFKNKGSEASSICINSGLLSDVMKVALNFSAKRVAATEIEVYQDKVIIKPCMRAGLKGECTILLTKIVK